jgi:hypothetical protein
MSRALLAAAALFLGASACAPSSAQRLAESANNLNMAARFGRMDMAAELVVAKSSDDFTKRHAGWGQSVRLVDIEINSMHSVDSDNADVTVSVSWIGPDDTTLRLTELKQRWHDARGTWKLVSEERLGGEYGLFGDVAPRSAPEAQPDKAAASREAQFRTRVLSGSTD